MSEKPALFDPISEREMFDVTAYLIAITPDLQKSSKQKRGQQVARDAAISKAADATGAAPAQQIDLAVARKTYEDACSQCHELEDINKAPPKTAEESRAMIQRMIKENEAELTAAQIELIAAWLDAAFVAQQKK
jgi:mono/diheme cytochrome c family protein